MPPVGGAFLAQATRGNYKNSRSHFNIQAWLDLTLCYLDRRVASSLRQPLCPRDTWRLVTAGTASTLLMGQPDAKAPAQTVSRGSQSKFTGRLPPGACEGGLQTDRSPPAPGWPQPGPRLVSGGLVPQLAAGIGDPLVLSEVAQSSTEAADLFHVGLRHPPLLTIGQTHALQPA